MEVSWPDEEALHIYEFVSVSEAVGKGAAEETDSRLRCDSGCGL